MKKNKNNKIQDDLGKMVSSKTLAWISVVIAIIVGRNEIFSFITSFSQGLTSILNSLPPVALILLLIIFIFWLGRNK